MRFALCAFPLVGAVVGAAWWCWGAVCALVPVGDVLRGVGLCLLPVLLTGGIHLDGYADVCDALASCGAPEQKQAILKDPHCGAFAVIRLCTYFVASFALCAALSPTVPALWTLGLGFVFSRALSGFAVCRFPLARHTGLAHAFSAAADRRCAGRVLLLLAAADCWARSLWRRGFWRSGVAAWWRSDSSARFREIWRAGLCSVRSCGCCWLP